MTFRNRHCHWAFSSSLWGRPSFYLKRGWAKIWSGERIFMNPEHEWKSADFRLPFLNFSLFKNKLKEQRRLFFFFLQPSSKQTGNKNKPYDIISLVTFFAEPPANSRRGRSAEGPFVCCDWAAAAEVGDPVKRVHQQPLGTVCRCLTLCQSAGTNLWINSALQALYFLSFPLVSHHLTS